MYDDLSTKAKLLEHKRMDANDVLLAALGRVVKEPVYTIYFLCICFAHANLRLESRGTKHICMHYLQNQQK